MEEPMDIDGQLDQQMAPQLPALGAPPAPVQIACPFQENACERVFPNDRQVKVHLLNDHKAKQYLCPISGCVEAFRTVDGLFRHLDQMNKAFEFEKDQAVRDHMHSAYDEDVCFKCGIEILREPFSLRKLDKILDHKQGHRECIKPDCRIADGGTEVDLLVHNTLAHNGLVQVAAAAAVAAARLAQENEHVHDPVRVAVDGNGQPVLGPRAGQDNEPVANIVPGDHPRNDQAQDPVVLPDDARPNLPLDTNGLGGNGGGDLSDGERRSPNIDQPAGEDEPATKRPRMQ